MFSLHDLRFYDFERRFLRGHAQRSSSRTPPQVVMDTLLLPPPLLPQPPFAVGATSAPADSTFSIFGSSKLSNKENESTKAKVDIC
jgi:hypothetical protein